MMLRWTLWGREFLRRVINTPGQKSNSQSDGQTAAWRRSALAPGSIAEVLGRAISAH